MWFYQNNIAEIKENSIRGLNNLVILIGFDSNFKIKGCSFRGLDLSGFKDSGWHILADIDKTYISGKPL